MKGDIDAYRKAKKASDAFEHGFLGFDEIWKLSQDVRNRVATYVRESILRLSGLDSATFEILTSKPFDEPLGHWPVVKYLRGKLFSERDNLAAKGNAYPFVRWRHEIKTCKFDETGELQIE